MGKQINYYMEFESFVRVAEKALALGCEIILNAHTDEIRRGFSLDLVTPDCKHYFFRVPEDGEITVKQDMHGKCFVDDGYSVSGSTLIKAGFSYISPEKNRISRARLFCISSYYDSSGNLIRRPECVTKTYNALMRDVKKLAPYTELTDVYTSMQEETYLQQMERRHKEYITDYCLHLREAGYQLG